LKRSDLSKGSGRVLSDVLALINRTDEKFGAFAKHLLTSLTRKDKAAPAFTAEELTRLPRVLAVSAAEVDTVVEAATFIFEQAAYANISKDFAAHLTAVKVSAGRAAAFANAWSEGRDAFLNKLRDTTLGTPHVLSDVQWRLQMTLSTDAVGRSKDVNAIVNFNLIDANRIGKADAKDSVTAELSKESLTRLYDKLEVIQKQLDTLS